MGTRVCAWIGNPHDYDNREYLGSLAYDGYNIPPLVAEATSAEEFRRIWLRYARQHDHFCPPERQFPFPWADDIFITDITVAWFAPDGHPEGPYRDYSLYGRHLPNEQCVRVLNDPKWEAHPAPEWPSSYGSRKKAVWLSCAVEADIDRRKERRFRDIKTAVQKAYNEIPGDDLTDEWQKLAQEACNAFDDKRQAVWDLHEKQLAEAAYKSAPIPGPAKAHSAYERQPEADSIMVISV